MRVCTCACVCVSVCEDPACKAELVNCQTVNLKVVGTSLLPATVMLSSQNSTSVTSVQSGDVVSFLQRMG